jgi:hypothetical protein
MTEALVPSHQGQKDRVPDLHELKSDSQMSLLCYGWPLPHIVQHLVEFTMRNFAHISHTPNQYVVIRKVKLELYTLADA